MRGGGDVGDRGDGEDSGPRGHNRNENCARGIASTRTTLWPLRLLSCCARREVQLSQHQLSKHLTRLPARHTLLNALNKPCPKLPAERVWGATGNEWETRQGDRARCDFAPERANRSRCACSQFNRFGFNTRGCGDGRRSERWKRRSAHGHTPSRIHPPLALFLLT